MDEAKNRALRLRRTVLGGCIAMLMASSCSLFSLFTPTSDVDKVAGNYVSEYVSPTDSTKEVRVELNLDSTGQYDQTEYQRAAGTSDTWAVSVPKVSGDFQVDLTAQTMTFTPSSSSSPVKTHVEFNAPLLIVQIDKNGDGDYQDAGETTVYYDTGSG